MEETTQTLDQQPKNPTGENTAAAGQGIYCWEDVKKDPEINRQIQAVVKRRLKEAAEASHALTQLQPALIAYGLDPENPDYTAVSTALQEALQPGQAPAAPEVEAVETMDVAKHLQSLQEQAKQLQQSYPGFSLEKAMEDPAFLRLTAPGGVSVQQAHFALHHDDIQRATLQVAAKHTAQALSRSIASGHRPLENGTTQQAGSVLTMNYRAATPAQRQALKDSIRAAAARGEKIYPG